MLSLNIWIVPMNNKSMPSQSPEEQQPKGDEWNGWQSIPQTLCSTPWQGSTVSIKDNLGIKCIIKIYNFTQKVRLSKYLTREKSNNRQPGQGRTQEFQQISRNHQTGCTRTRIGGKDKGGVSCDVNWRIIKQLPKTRRWTTGNKTQVKHWKKINSFPSEIAKLK